MAPEHGIDGSIDRAVCVGSGPCFVIAPGAFALDLDMKAVILDAASETEERLLEAAAECPTQAIYLSKNGSSVYP